MNSPDKHAKLEILEARVNIADQLLLIAQELNTFCMAIEAQPQQTNKNSHLRNLYHAAVETQRRALEILSAIATIPLTTDIYLDPVTYEDIVEQENAPESEIGLRERVLNLALETLANIANIAVGRPQFNSHSIARTTLWEELTAELDTASRDQLSQKLQSIFCQVLGVDSLDNHTEFIPLINTAAQLFVLSRELGFNAEARAMWLSATELRPMPNMVETTAPATIETITAEQQQEIDIKQSKFAAAIGKESVTIESANGEQREVPVTVGYYNQYNSSPLERTGVFDPEIIAQFCLEFHQNWGFKYDEGYFDPQGEDLWDIDINELLDPRKERKVARGWIELDKHHKGLKQLVANGELESDEVVAQRMQEQGWVQMWNPVTVERYFDDVLAKGGEFRLVFVDGRLAAWIVSNPEQPEAKLGGRALFVDGQQVDTATYVETIGHVYESRMIPRRFGNIKNHISKTLRLVNLTNLISEATNRIMITRMHLQDRVVQGFAMGQIGKILGNFEPAITTIEPDCGDVKPRDEADRRRGVGQIISTQDPDRGYYVRTWGRREVKIAFAEPTPISESELLEA